MRSTLEYCPVCKSNNIRYRKNRDNWICDDCDYVFVSTQEHSKRIENKSNVRIFISYGHDTTKIIERIIHDLKKLNYDVWVDSEEIKSGDDWRNRITEGILNSQVILAMLSTYGLRPNGVCLDELAIASGCNRNCIRTCLMDNDAKSLIPPTINGIEYIDMTAWKSLTGECFEKWYDIKFQEIINNILSIKEPKKDPILKEIELRIRPIITPNLYSELTKHITKREWLSNHVRTWIEKSPNQIMLLTAYPGGGKTTFCIHHFHFHPMLTCLVVCNHSSDRTDKTSQVIRNIAYQMALSSISYRKNLLWTLTHTKSDLENIDLHTLFDLLICTPYRLEIDGNHAPIIIVIDGLDALDQNGKNKLAELISHNINKMPCYVNILISTRHSEAIISQINNSYKVDINPTSQETTEDLASFLRETLPDASYETIDNIAKKCRGSFLYASVLSSAIQEDLINPYDPNLLVTSRIGDIYYQAMIKIFSDNTLYNCNWRAIALLIAANGEIPAEALQCYLQWSLFELNSFCALMMSFFRRWVDYNGCLWITIVYPSFISWITNQNSFNRFHIPLQLAYNELANAIWERYCAGKELLDYELVNMNNIFTNAKQEDRNSIIYRDIHLLQHLIQRIKILQEYPHLHQTMFSFMKICQKINSCINSEESNRMYQAELPFIEIQLLFMASKYHQMIQYYEQEKNLIEHYCSPQQRLHILYMISTAFDYIGERNTAVKLFNKLAELARLEISPLYEFYALVGLLWNDHFNNITDGERIIKQLNSFSYNLLGEENDLMRKLMIARFKASNQEIKEAFEIFKEVISTNNHVIWGYNNIAFRIQMLLVESLVSAYDNYEYLQGIKIGEHIYTKIKDSVSVAVCYCASWLVMNYIHCGNYEKVEILMAEAESKYEQLAKIGESDWIKMHLKSVRSQVAIEKQDITMAMDLLLEVIKLAIKTSDAWVLGDALFDLFTIIHIYHIPPVISQQEILCQLQQISQQSGLPHLKYKTKIVETIMYPQKEDAVALLKETTNILKIKPFASTNYLVVAYMCYGIYKQFYSITPELKKFVELIINTANEVDQRNPGINFVKRNYIINILKKDYYEC